MNTQRKFEIIPADVLASMTLKQLKDQCRKDGVAGYSKFNKADLVQFVISVYAETVTTPTPVEKAPEVAITEEILSAAADEITKDEETFAEFCVALIGSDDEKFSVNQSHQPPLPNECMEDATYRFAPRLDADFWYTDDGLWIVPRGSGWLMTPEGFRIAWLRKKSAVCHA